MKKILTILLFLIPCICFASGHNNGLQYLPIVFAIFAAAALTALLNVIAMIVSAFSRSAALLGLLWVCLALNCLWLCYGIYVLVGRYQQHMDYQAYGEGVDKAGFSNFTSKASIIMFMICVAIIIDIVLIIRKRNERRQYSVQA